MTYAQEYKTWKKRIKLKCKVKPSFNQFCKIAKKDDQYRQDWLDEFERQALIREAKKINNGITKGNEKYSGDGQENIDPDPFG